MRACTRGKGACACEGCRMRLYLGEGWACVCVKGVQVCEGCSMCMCTWVKVVHMRG